MKTFRKLLFSVLIFVLTILVVSASIIYPLLSSEWEHCFDSKNRERLSGTINLLICGASQGMNHYNTHIIDEKLCTCYNISGPAMTWSAKAMLLEEELLRNDVKYVIIDISHNSLMQEPSVSGEYYALPRISQDKQLQYFFTRISFLQQFELYGKLMNEGSRYLASAILGESNLLGTTNKINNCNYSDKGFRYAETTNIALIGEEIVQNYKIKKIDTHFPSYNMYYLNQMISSCKEHGAQPIIVESIASDRLNWEYDGMQNLHNYLFDYCKEKDCLFIDANLLIKRFSVFSDDSSFADDQHLSGEGATKYTEMFCNLLHLYENGTDISDMFYKTYDDMEKESPYYRYYSYKLKHPEKTQSSNKY